MQFCRRREGSYRNGTVDLEQLINTMPSQVRVWVKERKPKTSKEAGELAGELADDYVQARGLEIDTHNPGFRKTVKPGTGRLCHGCGKPGHQIKDCQMKKPLEGRDRMTGRSTEKAKRDLKDIECFNCHKKGHYSSNCPHNALLCSAAMIRQW